MARTDGPVGLGIVGAGFGGYGLTPAFRRDPRCEVRAIATASPESGAEAMDRYGIARTCTWQELVAADDIDAIAIASPPLLQAEIAAAALGAGKAVFAEKLLAADLETGSRLCDLAAGSGLANMVDFIFPELVTWRRLHRELSEARIGQVRHVFLDWRMESFDVRTGKRGWKTSAEGRGGVLSHFAIHSLHYLEWLLGPVETLAASLSTCRGLPATGDTTAILALTFESGATGGATFSNAAFGGSGHGLTLHGSDGVLRLSNPTANPVGGFVLEGMNRDGAMETLETEPLEGLASGEDSRILPVERIARRLVDWIVDGRPARPDFRDGLRALHLRDIALASHEAGGGRLDCRPDGPARPA